MTFERPIIVTIEPEEVEACQSLFRRIYERANQCGFTRDRYPEEEEQIIYKFLAALALLTSEDNEGD